MTTALLTSTFFGPIQWYQKLYRYDRVLIEHHDSYQKQTYRNRCLIATQGGVQALTVPVSIGNGEQRTERTERAERTDTSESALLSDHGNWRHQHWQALQAAYGDSPFFIYYEDDLRPFFTDNRWATLYDYNDAICRKMCELLDISPNMTPTDHFIRKDELDGIDDFREVIQPKHPASDAQFVAKSYYQVFERKHGFLPNLSILDLLMNMGPESIFFL